ncbi:hypothetical protein [Chryseobacterium vrystaatense]|uniref:Uncharacterized protein n=1 Tax=Chryseobacterium vrystaatense TaxID=307480 RepID=A0A1M4ZHP4_9FLAO|nr:hypothetical protein [Chryseobacterium vrystaatense]SHF17521.1 hypothetical protein SAMN02787073_1600 [Chryseobacterium vrystaatense]
MILQPMTDFVLEQNKKYKNLTRCIRIKESELYVNYANFLKQPLMLGQFVPVDEEGNVLTQPHLGMFHDNRAPLQDLNFAKIEYEKAKEKVLFEGFDLIKSDIETLNHTTFIENVNGEQVGYNKSWENEWNLYGIVIEDLVGFNIELTESALKQIGIE